MYIYGDLDSGANTFTFFSVKQKLGDNSVTDTDESKINTRPNLFGIKERQPLK